VLRRSPEPAAARALADRVAPGAGGDLGRAITAAARRTAAIAVEPQVLVGDPADALLRATGRAALLVLGSRAYGPAGVVLPGGAATAVLGSARCPVALAPRAAA